MIFPSACGCGDHDAAIDNEVRLLEKRGYVCEREYKINLDNNKRKFITVDIRATKGPEEMLIEVGSLSRTHVCFPWERIDLLKTLRPNAKIIHITQWKNWITQFDIQANQSAIDLERGTKLTEELSERDW